MNPAPFLVSFSNADAYVSALSDFDRLLYEHEIRRLIEHKLPPIVSTSALAVMFGYSSQFVKAMTSKPNRYYRTFAIPAGKKKRIIHAPKVAIKAIQKWFGYHLDLKFENYPIVHGFVRGKSAASAALVHCGAKWIYSVDLRNFFSSTITDVVLEALLSLGYSENGAQIVTNLCCLDGGLAQGSPASPILSNIVFREADRSLIEIAFRYGIRYTRYADDLVFSGLENFRHPEFNSEVQHLAA